MYNFNVFNCQFKAVQLSLGRECCLSGKEALVQVMNKDFQEVKWNFLSDPDLNAHYHHEYENTKQKDVFIMRVANKRVFRRAKDFIEDNTQIRFPYLYVILDCRQETPTVMIEDYQEVPSSLKEVVAVLTYSINMAMESKGWKVKLMKQQGELSPVPISLRSVMEPLQIKPRTIEEFHGVNHIWEVYMKMEKMRKTPDIRNKIICKDCAEEILALLHNLIDGKTTPKSIMRPIHAAIVAGVTNRIPLSMFSKEFGNIMEHSSTLFYDYQAKDAPVYYNDDMTKSIIKMFTEIVSSYNKKIG